MLDEVRPFTRADARAAGLTDRDLRGSAFTQVFRGVYVSSRVTVTPRMRAEAALMLHPTGTVASHTTAARLYGAPVPASHLEHVSVSDPRHRRTRNGLRAHATALKTRDSVDLHGLRVSSPARMFVELASILGLVDLVVVGDWLVAQRLVEPDALKAYCARAHAPHVRRAAEAADYVRPRVESPMETRLRLLLVLAGLPEPQINVEIRDEAGIVVLRLDLAYPAARLGVEYDGRQHLTSVDQWERDVVRRDDLPDGWRLITVTSRGIFHDPQHTIDRVRQALERRGVRGPGGTSDAWRPYFGR